MLWGVILIKISKIKKVKFAVFASVLPNEKGINLDTQK